MDVIMIANTAEAFAALLKKVAHTPEGARRIRHELTLSQRAFFWGGDNKCVITPYPIPTALLQHNAERCGYGNVVNLSPREPTVSLSKAVMNDTIVRREVVAAMKGSSPVRMSPYAFTDDFLWLLRELTRRGVEVDAEGIPKEQSFWTAKHLDSKLGFRTEMLKLMGTHEFLRIPDGFVAQNKTEVLDIIEWFYSQNRSAVVKVNFGESGWGLWIFRVEEYSSSADASDIFRRVLASDPVWKDFPVIVEEFVEADVAVAGGSPSVELVIQDGPVIIYHCGQILNDAGEFFGVEIGKGAVPDGVKASMERVGKVVGERYHALGYRGYCDIDFVVSRTGVLYAVETNPRRTGGTHVYDLAKHLYGETWEDQAYLISYDSFRYGDRTIKAKTILERTQPLLYPIAGKRRGIIITSLNAWEPVMGYVVIAASPKEGRKLQQELLGLFDH